MPVFPSRSGGARTRWIVLLIVSFDPDYEIEAEFCLETKEVIEYQEAVDLHRMRKSPALIMMAPSIGGML